MYMGQERTTGVCVCTCCKPSGATASRLSQRRPKPQFKSKSNGMQDIRWPVVNYLYKNVLKREFSSYSVRYWG